MVSMPNYRASSVHAGKLKESLDKMQIGETMVLVLQLFDNGIFMVSTEEGGYIPMHKGVDGILHAIGDLEVVPKDLQWRLFEQVAKDLEMFKKNPMVILAPLPSYMEAPCCTKEGHMVNRSKESFKQKLEEDIYHVRLNLKNFAFRKGWKNTVTVSTWGRVKKLDRIWVDAINLTEDGYFAISEAAVEAVAGIRGKRKTSETPTAPTPAKKPKINRPEGGEQGWTRGRGHARCGQPRGRGGQHLEAARGYMRGGGGGRHSWNRGQPARRGGQHNYFF
jgi:hypothetical protein